MKVLAGTQRVASTLGALSADIERARTPPPEVMAELARAGAFRMLVPAALGGEEVSPLELVEVTEQVARGDAATGWCVMVGATSGLVAANMEDAGAREVFADPDVITCGVFAPLGRAEDRGDAWLVSGRWPFASASHHARFRMGGAIVEGSNEILHVVFRAEETTLLDTWHTAGLRGTGSDDMVADRVLVPKTRALRFVGGAPRHEGVLYKFPMYGLLALGVSAVATAIARQTLDAFHALATAKTPAFSRRPLAHHDAIAADVAACEASLGAARAFVREVTLEATRRAEVEGALPPAARARLRAAATHATRTAADVTTRVYEAAGGTAIYDASPFQRHLRDVHVATQHVMVSRASLTLAGKVLLGVETDATML
jgi:alkylation response protein AidB-like acyl-CoA dehydrogenase